MYVHVQGTVTINHSFILRHSGRGVRLSLPSSPPIFPRSVRLKSYSGCNGVWRRSLRASGSSLPSSKWRRSACFTLRFTLFLLLLLLLFLFFDHHCNYILLLYLALFHIAQAPMNYSVHHRTTHFYYRNEIIGHLDSNYHLLSQICTNLYQYMSLVKNMLSGGFTCSCRVHVNWYVLCRRYMYRNVIINID